MIGILHFCIEDLLADAGDVSKIVGDCCAVFDTEPFIVECLFLLIDNDNPAQLQSNVGVHHLAVDCQQTVLDGSVYLLIVDVSHT